jgi:hypothetical protein
VKVPDIYVVVHVGYSCWTLHGWFFDQNEAYALADSLNKLVHPSMEYHVERVEPGSPEHETLNESSL